MFLKTVKLKRMFRSVVAIRQIRTIRRSTVVIKIRETYLQCGSNASSNIWNTSFAPCLAELIYCRRSAYLVDNFVRILGILIYFPSLSRIELSKKIRNIFLLCCIVNLLALNKEFKGKWNYARQPGQNMPALLQQTPVYFFFV